jgi:hypothetical protein
MPKSALELRLERQLAAKGTKDATGLAHALLVNRGHIQPNGDLTAAGKKRDAFGPAGRAKNRAAEASGHSASAYTYDPRTNSAKLKK